MAGTRRNKRWIALGVAALVGAGLVGVGTDTAAAAKPKITAAYAGPVNCTATGTTKYKPGLTNAVAARAMTIKAKLACSTGPTGTAGITVTSGKLTVTGTHTGSCTNSSGPLAGSIKWKAIGGKVNPTQISWPGFTRTFGPPIIDRIDAGFTSSFQAIRGLTSGSFHRNFANTFAGPGIEALLVNSGATQATCASPKGIKKLAFTGAVGIKRMVSIALCAQGEFDCNAYFDLTPGRGWLVVLDQTQEPGPLYAPTGTVSFTSAVCPGLFPATITPTPHAFPFGVGNQVGVHDYGPLASWDLAVELCDLRFSYHGDSQTLRSSFVY